MKHIRVQDQWLIEAIKELDGTCVDELVAKYGLPDQLPKFLEYLSSVCLIEEVSIAQVVNESPYNRVLNFLADYFPSGELINAFERIRNSHVLLVGVGAVGSWIAHLLAQSGVKHLILCDPDIVKAHNLNRSLFVDSDKGKMKTKALGAKLEVIDHGIEVSCFEIMINDVDDLDQVLSRCQTCFDLVINASDYPNVDITSKTISTFCMSHNIPHIIAGGYNLHLSLIGPTIIPKETPCFYCISRRLEGGHPEDFSRVRKLYRPKRNIGNLSPLAGISASFTCFEAIRVLVKSERLRPVMVGRRGEFNFLTSKLNFSEYSRMPDCEWCGSII
ncbi:MAG: ThiF family adenylyltransferase [Syntrophotaleaceae bacterium]